MMQPATLDPVLGADFHQQSADLLAERNELTRQAAQRAIDKHIRGEHVDPEHLRWCREFVKAVKPLGRALGAGEPL